MGKDTKSSDPYCKWRLHPRIITLITQCCSSVFCRSSLFEWHGPRGNFAVVKQHTCFVLCVSSFHRLRHVLVWHLDHRPQNLLTGMFAAFRVASVFTQHLTLTLANFSLFPNLSFLVVISLRSPLHPSCVSIERLRLFRRGNLMNILFLCII